MYPTDAAPPVFKILIDFNPLSNFVVIFRDAILPDGSGLHLKSWIIACMTSVAAFAIGYFGVRRAQRFVGDLV
jgi:ABC-type polysaccharide/polyol phosphate export permease